jgi:hypothetical protein
MLQYPVFLQSRSLLRVVLDAATATTKCRRNRFAAAYTTVALNYRHNTQMKLLLLLLPLPCNVATKQPLLLLLESSTACKHCTCSPVLLLLLLLLLLLPCHVVQERPPAAQP